MADLITHSCVAILLKVVTRTPHLATFVLGTCLPDFLGRVPAMGLTVVRWSAPWVPEWTIYLWGPFHMPVGIVLTSFVASFAFPSASRRAAFLNLLGGGMLHIGVDVLQRHFGVGYLLLFPFSEWDWEAGLIGSEDTVFLAPVLALVTVFALFRRRAAQDSA